MGNVCLYFVFLWEEGAKGVGVDESFDSDIFFFVFDFGLDDVFLFLVKFLDFVL